MIKMKTFYKIIASIIVFLAIASIGASFYFFHVAQVRGDKSFISHAATPKSSPVYQDEKDFLKLDKENLSLKNDGLNLKAWYVPAENKTDKTVIVVHGFNGSKEKMTAYGMLFHKLGYNVLMPDNRAHGASDGTLIGYGVTDKRDLIKWTNQLIKTNPKSEITTLVFLWAQPL
jgi:predicted alpha/beta-fold hydrolase